MSWTLPPPTDEFLFHPSDVLNICRSYGGCPNNRPCPSHNPQGKMYLKITYHDDKLNTEPVHAELGSLTDVHIDVLLVKPSACFQFRELFLEDNKWLMDGEWVHFEEIKPLYPEDLDNMCQIGSVLHHDYGTIKLVGELVGDNDYMHKTFLALSNGPDDDNLECVVCLSIFGEWYDVNNEEYLELKL